MGNRHLSVRIDEGTFERLDAESRRVRESRSQLAKGLLEEGLRMREHPGIVFRSGPAGRRAALADGPDVWVVARVLRGIGPGTRDVIERTAELTGLDARQVRIAARYYAAYGDEVDEWLRQLDEEAEQARESWLRERALIGS
jgi:hypothetical protein